jgi:hypothetical protein
MRRLILRLAALPFTAALVLAAPAHAQSLAEPVTPAMAPTAVVATGDSTVAHTTVAPAAASQPVALRARTHGPTKAPKMQADNNRTNTALMLVGLATILVGTVVDDDAGTVLILTGAAIGIVGLYRFLT